MRLAIPVSRFLPPGQSPITRHFHTLRRVVAGAALLGVVTACDEPLSVPVPKSDAASQSITAVSAQSVAKGHNDVLSSTFLALQAIPNGSLTMEQFLELAMAHAKDEAGRSLPPGVVQSELARLSARGRSFNPRVRGAGLPKVAEDQNVSPAAKAAFARFEPALRPARGNRAAFLDSIRTLKASINTTPMPEAERASLRVALEVVDSSNAYWSKNGTAWVSTLIRKLDPNAVRDWKAANRPVNIAAAVLQRGEGECEEVFGELCECDVEEWNAAGGADRLRIGQTEDPCECLDDPEMRAGGDRSRAGVEEDCGGAPGWLRIVIADGGGGLSGIASSIIWGCAQLTAGQCAAALGVTFAAIASITEIVQQIADWWYGT
jgi:hypothetical protein